MQKRRIWDITPPLDAATPVFPGDTPFAVRWLSRLENGAGANVSEITFTPHDGAHADAPLHLDSAADDVASLRLETFIGRALVIDLSLDDSLEPIGPEALTANTFPARILFKTRTKRPQPGRRISERFLLHSCGGSPRKARRLSAPMRRASTRLRANFSFRTESHSQTE